MKPFWMVYGEGGRAPAKQHWTRESAVAEANRLALISPGQRFHLLKSTHSYVDEPRRAQVFAHDDPDDIAHLAGAAALFDRPDIPF